jgi:hypothetical protein
MNKDAILATIIGFLIGLCITALIVFGPKALKFFPSIRLNLPKFTLFQTKPAPNADKTPKEFSVTIDSPLPDSIEATAEVLVSGTTLPETTVVIQGNTNDAITTGNAEGKYAGKIALVEGKNEITVTGYLKDKIIRQSVTVFYTQEEL